jgi:hypothetical protein
MNLMASGRGGREPALDVETPVLWHVEISH